ncbi:MAG: ornithine carbamoyltransferase [Chloroflexi bacterium]|nr:ornithine carbamoyltransferase [Chloroflexota bacterium]
MESKDLVAISDLSADDVWEIIDTAVRLKREHADGNEAPLLKGKTLGMVFEKPSLRTRVSFEVAMLQLGGHALYLSPNEIQLGSRESVPDVARVLSRYVDGIMIRTFAHSNVEELARHASVPVINGLSDLSHPCQALGDLLTIHEKKGRLKGTNLAYVGDGNNVAHSLLLAASKAGMNVAVATPKGFECNPEVVRLARESASSSGSKITLTNSPQEAVRGAGIVYTDVWASMGQESEREQRIAVFTPYRIDSNLLARAASDALVMHCLPAHRGEEITDEVIDGPHSIVFDQAENRLHIQKAILVLLMSGRGGRFAGDSGGLESRRP